MVRFGGQPEHGKGRLAQLVEHRLYTPAVTGSSPVPPTKANREISDLGIQIFRLFWDFRLLNQSSEI